MKRYGAGYPVSSSNEKTWVVDVDGIAVALLVVDAGSIDQLYVDPDYVRRGIGSHLVYLAKRLNPDGLELWTFQANIRARRFSEHHGSVANQFTDGENEEGEPDVRYRWTGV
jgi:ribosomal protein S18 acetylase RimI-like enzyme